MNTGFKKLHKVVNDARLSASTRQQVLQTIDRLPPLYGELDRTYDIRYRDGIVRLVETMLHSLDRDSEASSDGSKVAGVIMTHLADMHQRLGIPSLGMKKPVAVRSAKRKG
jgi:hypothetical protein